MTLSLTEPLGSYLNDCECVDLHHSLIQSKALELANGCSRDIEIAKKCFEYVRDHIKHSIDYQTGPVTLKASEVLTHKVGYCYAKSHLLAALLRANNIPAGLCYQRLFLDDSKQSYCLHGLNAVHLKNYGWYRIDARGNNTNVNAQFNPPHEQLAFNPAPPGEMDSTLIYAKPLYEVKNSLTHYTQWDVLLKNLPDIDTKI